MGSAIEYIANCKCIPNRPVYPDPYRFNFSGQTAYPENTKLFESNRIRTTKYTLFTFLPKALLLQFKRLANVYFLFVAILLSIKIIAPVNALSAWVPLIIVIAISMIRQGYEDVQRYLSDKKLNYQMTTTIIRGGQQLIVKWSDVNVGDFCKVQRQQTFPADLILLSSSNEGNVCFIETASLDGQKNLKPRSAYPATAICNSLETIRGVSGTFQGDFPNKDINQFEGRLNISPNTVVNISGIKQFLYRGTRLKNTKVIYGLVIYTGKNTKIMLNSDSQSQKMSQVQRKVNYILGIVLVFQIILCLICAIGYGITRYNHQLTDNYIAWESNWAIALDSFIIFFTYFVLINTLIPISLIVSMQMVKLFQKYFIQKDQFMYSSFRKQYVSVQSASLNQELGQIQYVFTDKTGTLTMNIMEFKIAVIGTHLFGDRDLVNNPTQSKPKNKGFRDDQLKKMLSSGVGDQPLYQKVVIKNRQKNDQLLYSRKRELAQEYFLLLGLAHQVVTQQDKNGQLIYQGPSPDQIALVEAAKTMDYQFVRSSQAETVIKVRGRQKKFQLLQVFPFSSDRKRMSIVLRDPRDNRIKMLTKGADSIVKARLSPDQKLNLDHQLEQFSKIGLRTLLLAMRIISQNQYNTFVNKIQSIPQAQRQKQSQKLISQLQTDLYLIGATAVLDRLQEDVPETIRDLIRANIKVWMLTGDKMETAENIAKSCRLIQPQFKVLKFHLDKQLPQRGGNSSTDKLDREKQIAKNVDRNLQSLVQQAQQLEKQNRPKALLVEGQDLTQILKQQSSQSLLVELAKSCEAVVCCRLQPKQKASVVQLVRQRLDKITLAIGDGANDVPMIKTAHIGIGLYGQQGMGAVQASDYALPQFRMLWRLLFVHGRWNYIRISEMILYFFYKNMLFTLPQFIAAFFNGFSGQTIFDDIYITLYNLTFTALPLVIRAVLEQDVNYVYARDLEEAQMEPQMTGRSILQQKDYLPGGFGINKYFYRLFPKIYFIGQENCIFNYKNYFMWMLQGVLQAILITVFCFYIFGQSSINSDGINPDYRLTGLTIYASVVLLVTFKLATHTRFWSVCLILSILITSLGFFVAYTWISNFALSQAFQGTPYIGYSNAEPYFVVLFCICLVLLLDGVIVFIDFKRGSFASKMRQVMKEDQINNKLFYDNISLYITEGLTEQGK